MAEPPIGAARCKNEGGLLESFALPEFSDWVCLTVLAGLVLATFSDVLFFRPERALSDPTMDTARFFIHWRSFGFQELRAGRLPLWNPHYFSGTPFFGNFQSALLYPLNLPFLFLPIAPAINWTIALHVFLGGAFTFFWMRHRRLHSLACLLSAIMFMYCGPHFLQINAGHLPNLCTLIWAPLLFLAIDRMVDRPGLGPCLLGMFALAMAIMAGHPQLVFYMGVAGGVYALLNLWQADARAKVVFGLTGMVAGATCLSAIQLFTGLQEGAETGRSAGMSYEFASSYSFPPENFLTLVAPGFFGDMTHDPYWGRWYLTEVSLFVSVTGLVLAIYGMAQGRPEKRRFSLVLLSLTLLLAMGSSTPVFHFLYSYVPGFNLFRGMDKFLWLCALFLAALAGIGADELLRGRPVPRWMAWSVAGLGVLVCGLSFVPTHADWWSGMVKSLHSDAADDPLIPFLKQAVYISRTKTVASASLISGGLYLLIAGALLYLAKTRRAIAVGTMLALATVELAAFGGNSLATFHPDPPGASSIVQFLAQHPGDYRIRFNNPNSALTSGALDVSGDDPGGLQRYLRFLSFAAGVAYDPSPQHQVEEHPNSDILRMVRLRYLMADDAKTWTELPGGLPHVLLVNRFRVATNYQNILATLTKADFKIDREVVLESQPDPLPQANAATGTVRITDSSTDFLDLTADVAAPSLLLITDAYSRNWRARPLPGSVQAQYTVMPANLCLRAIPLAVGRHLLRVEYSPLGFRVGRVVSLAALVVFLGLIGLVAKAQFQRRTQDER